jgi:hypothetical protein
MGVSYTQRTLKALRDQGLTADIAERFIKGANKGRGIRKDLFGFIDIVALGGKRGIIGVQSTGKDFAGHKKKILEERNEAALDWLRSGGRALLWSWRKEKVKKGGKAEQWVYKEYEFTLADFGAEPGFNPLEGA